MFENTGDDRKNRLVAAFLNRFMEYYEAQNSVAGNQANAEAVAGVNVQKGFLIEDMNEPIPSTEQIEKSPTIEWLTKKPCTFL